MYRTWYRNCVNRIYPVGLGRGRTSARRKSCRRLRLEALEQRITPSTHTWTGAVSAAWSNSSNWIGGSPQGDNGADLEFPSHAHNFQNIDDIPGVLFIDSITFSGSGYGITLETVGAPLPSVSLLNGITDDATGTNSLTGMPISLVNSDLSIEKIHSFSVASGGTLVMDSLSDASGPDGVEVNTDGSGTLQLEGANSTYSGPTEVDAGTLAVGGVGIPPYTTVNLDAGATFSLLTDISVAFLNGPSGSDVNLAISNLHVQSGSFSGVIAGTASSTLSKDGTSTLNLYGQNTYTGATHVNSGTLSLAISGALNSNTAVTVNSGATLALDGNAEGIGSLAGAGNVSLGTKGYLSTGNNNASTTFSGLISGTGGILDKEGTGTFTLANANTYTGETDVNRGVLQIGANNAVPAASTVYVNGSNIPDFDLHGNSDTIGSLSGGGVVTLGGGTLATGTDNTSTIFSGSISGSGNLIKEGTGTFTLSGGNTYSGQTIVNGGVLQLGANNAIPATSAVTLSAIFFITPFGSSLLESGSLALNNFNDTIGSLSSTFTDPMTLGNGTLTSGGDNSSTTFTGVISGNGGLTKTGTGTFTLTGTNTYSGPTTVQAGILEVDGSCSNVTVNGGTLRGNGTVGGLTANAGATVQPGTALSPTTLHSSNFVNFLNASNFNVRLNSLTSYDQLSVSSGISLGGATLNVTVNYTANIGDTFPIIAATSVLSTFMAPNGTILANGATFTANGTVSGTAVQERFQINYTTTLIGTTVVLTRVAGPVTHFQIDTVSMAQAGAPFDFTVTGLDAGNNIVTLFTGTVGFSSQDPYGAQLPDNYTFTIGPNGDNGVHTFSAGATLFTVGTWDITATVLSTGASSSAFVTVTPAPAAYFAILAPATAQAGSVFDVTLAALDPYGNIDTNYQGTVHFTTTDPSGGQLPADYTFTAADNGVHTFAAGATLFTAGSQSLIVSDTASGINGAATVLITPAPANQFALAAPAQVAAGAPFDVTVTALDPYGNIDTNYQGTVTFSTSDTDPGVVLPADYTFQDSDQGVHTFSGGVTLITPGGQTVTATDTVSSITGSATVTVSGGGGGAAQPPGGPGGGGNRLVFSPVSNSIAASGPRWSVQTDQGVAALDKLFASFQTEQSRFRLSRLKHDQAGDSSLLDVFRVENAWLV